MYSVLYTAVPGPTGIANSFQQRRQRDRARTHTGYKRERKNGKFGPLPLSIPFQSQAQQDGVPPFHLTTRAINRITGLAKRPAQMHKEKRALAHSAHIKETHRVFQEI